MTNDDGGPRGALGIVIVGAGGFGGEVRQYVQDTFGADRGYYVKGFLDDAAGTMEFQTEEPVLGDTESYAVQASDRFVIAVGDPPLREKLADRLGARGARFVSVVHPLAYVSASANIGQGCIVSPFASVGAHAVLGDHSVLTFYASVAHDATVGRWCALSPHSVTNGGSRIADGVFLGAHAVVNPLRTVGDRAKVAAGAVVYRDVPADSLATGNPAKPRPQWPSSS